MSKDSEFKGRTVNFDLVDDWEAKGISTGYIYIVQLVLYIEIE